MLLSQEVQAWMAEKSKLPGSDNSDTGKIQLVEERKR
jgi:hypothetical protein